MACTICREEGHDRRRCPHAPQITATPRAPAVSVVRSGAREATPGPSASSNPARTIATLGLVGLLMLGGATTVYYLTNTSWTAVVTVPPEKKTGIIHSEPSQSAPDIGEVPNGMAVEVLDSRAPDRTWFRVRAHLRGSSVEGWMHRNILIPADR
jgi:Bacterial SH3 domain